MCGYIIPIAVHSMCPFRSECNGISWRWKQKVHEHLKRWSCETVKSNVVDLFLKLNLTKEETIADSSDDEGDIDLPPVESAVIGKVLSPLIIHVNTIWAAMKSAWGTPVA